MTEVNIMVAVFFAMLAFMLGFICGEESGIKKKKTRLYYGIVQVGEIYVVKYLFESDLKNIDKYEYITIFDKERTANQYCKIMNS